ncbi:MAG: bacillithiol biosynthesis deacetylase BshB1 [Bacteroidetes bacterium]|nr:bacillithiol biosynthesis deacetylase BshB1 [Bacteroidota bacterium]
MKLDILAFAAHPDDVEISCGATLIKYSKAGKKIGIIDLTQGELGTRGTPQIRQQEAAQAAEKIGLSIRQNLRMQDGFFELNESNKLAVIQVIRKYKPDIILANSVSDRHPDHARAGELVAEASFLSGLRKIETFEDGIQQTVHRPKLVLHYIQDNYIKPDVVLDISPYFNEKMELIKCFASQFYNPNSNEPTTPISGEEFFDFLKGRMLGLGRSIGVQFAEGFNTARQLGVTDLFDLK